MKKTNDEEDHMTVKQLQLEFNEGLIERAIVLLDDPNGTKRTLQFTSRTPIGFSSFRNYALELRRQYLVNRQEGLAVRLGDLIEYVPRLQTNARDFSPADTTFLFNEPGTTHILHKATLAQILKGAVFSDIVGVKEDKPNGLLQFEVGRRINLHTYRVGIAGGELFNISLVQFVRPNATLSKLDGKLRQMPAAYIGRVVNDQILPELIAKPLDLQQYENFNAGMDLNLFILDMQPSKTTFFLNTGFNFGHVSVADTLRQVVAGEIVSTRIPQHFSMPSFRFFPEFAFEVFPDSRLRFYGSYRFQWILGMDERVHLLPRLSSFSDSKSLALKAAHVTQLGATINLAPNIDLFLRYRHFIQNVYWKSAFQQVQVGTTIQFTKKMNPKP